MVWLDRQPVVALELIDSGAWSGTGVLGPEGAFFSPQPFLGLLLVRRSWAIEDERLVVKPWAIEERTPQEIKPLMRDETPTMVNPCRRKSSDGVEDLPLHHRQQNRTSTMTTSI